MCHRNVWFETAQEECIRHFGSESPLLKDALALSDPTAVVGPFEDDNMSPKVQSVDYTFQADKIDTEELLYKACISLKTFNQMNHEQQSEMLEMITDTVHSKVPISAGGDPDISDFSMKAWILECSKPSAPSKTLQETTNTVSLSTDSHSLEVLKAEDLCSYAPPSIRGEKRYTEEYLKCVLVTGGCGFVGSHVVEALLREGRNVVVYDMFNSETTKSAEKRENAKTLFETAKQNKANGGRLSIVEGNTRDGRAVAETVRKYGVTSCVHCAGMVDDRRSVHYPEEYLSNNVLGTSMLLDTLGKCGVKMVVQPSTRSVFGANNQDKSLNEHADRRPINPYGASKVATDALAACYAYLHDMNCTMVRIFATYGPRGRPDMLPRILIERIINDEPVKKFGDGSATRTWTYISDVVRAFIMALKNPQGGYEEFHTGAPNITTLNEMIACAEQVTGKKAIIHQYPTPPGDPHQVGHPDYSKISRELGWEPQVTVLEGMRHVYEHFMAKKISTDMAETKIDISDAVDSSIGLSSMHGLNDKALVDGEKPLKKQFAKPQIDCYGCSSTSGSPHVPNSYHSAPVGCN